MKQTNAHEESVTEARLTFHEFMRDVADEGIGGPDQVSSAAEPSAGVTERIRTNRPTRAADTTIIAPGRRATTARNG